MKALLCLMGLSFLSACQNSTRQESLPDEFQASSQLLFSQRRPLDSLLTIGPAQLSRWDSFHLTYLHRTESTNSLTEDSWKAMEKKLAEVESALLRYRSDPAIYNLGGALKQVLATSKIPLAGRLRAIESQMRQAPRYYQAAKANLSDPIPGRCRLAAGKQSLTIDFLNKELLDSLYYSSLNEQEIQHFRQAAEEARIAVKDYLAFCESIYFEHQDSIIENN